MLYKLGKGIFLLAMLLAGWIAFNSIDEAPHYDQSLLLSRVEVPDEQNGYAVLRYLGKDGDKALVLTDEDSRRLREEIVDWEWDRQFAERLLADHAGAIDLVKQVVARPRFSVDQFWENIYSEIPSYRPMLDLQRLVLLKARLDEDKGDYGDALEVANLAMKYCEKIRMDERGSLISYLVGWSCIANVTDFYHELLSNNMLSNNQLASIEESMNNVADYGKDGFDRTIKSELSKYIYISKWYEHYSILERLYIVHAAINEKILCYNCKYSALDIAYGYFNAVFARYYWHANEAINSRIASHKKVMLYAVDTCSSLDIPEFFNGSVDDLNDSKNLIDFLMPGSASKRLFSGTYEDFVLRRCGYYNHYSAIRGVIAIARYRLSHDGAYPDTLLQLIPDYLKKLPEDFFGKNGLQYDPANKRLYSVGVNHDNSTASDAGFYKGRCVHSNKDTVSACELSPTFPINWNDYKFYEKLNAAEAGDVNAQRWLGWMYHFGKYTDINVEKAVYWYEKAAEKHDAHAENLLGRLYRAKGSHCSNPGPTAVIEDDKKSFDWFKKSYEDGSLYGGNGYADYLISGSAGISDAQQAFRILTQQAINKDINYDEGLLYVLRNYWLPGIDESMLVSAWADYYLQHPDLLSGFSYGKLSGEQFMHQLLADNLWQNAYQYVASTPEERKNLDEWSAVLRGHYSAAHDDDGIKRLDEYVAEKIKASAEFKPEQRDFCKLVFDHRHEDMARFQAVQRQIFQNKKKSKELVDSFNKEMTEKYIGSHMVYSSDNGVMSLSFPAMNVKSLLGLIFDFSNLDTRDVALQFDDGIAEVNTMIYGDHFHPALAANLLLADLGLGAECTGGKVRIYVEDATKLKPKLLTENFITDWSGVEYKNGNLEGAGSITYAGGLKYKGDVVNGLPNGKGAYILGSDVLSGDGFVNGLLNGDGVTVENGHPVERGEYQNNALYGKGTYAYGYGGAVYEGNFKKGSGEGVVTYYDVGDLNTFYMPLDHTYPPIWSFSGIFKDGQKTTGTCSIYRDRQVVDSFACEFSEDSLVKIGNVSLLPPS